MFEIAGDDYDRFMGRFSRQLAAPFAAAAGVAAGMDIVDVGCGTGMLTAALAPIVGAEHVAAIDPQEQFVAATRARVPGADIRQGAAESLPWPARSFDAALAQLVVAFMADPVAGLREMSRVVRDGGVVAYAMWLRDDLQVSALFERAAESIGLTPRAARPLLADADALRGLAADSGLTHVETSTIRVAASYDGFAELWDTYGLGVGPLAAFYAALDDAQRTAIRAAMYDALGRPTGPLELTATALVVVGGPARTAD
jgi:ubiquinone/menaquinone biosynthesis C-methylase UbiE